MFKSAKRDKTEGFTDRAAGWVLEMVGKVTGRTSTKAKGKAARGRGAVRSRRGAAKRAMR